MATTKRLRNLKVSLAALRCDKYAVHCIENEFGGARVRLDAPGSPLEQRLVAARLRMLVDELVAEDYVVKFNSDRELYIELVRESKVLPEGTYVTISMLPNIPGEFLKVGDRTVRLNDECRLIGMEFGVAVKYFGLCTGSPCQAAADWLSKRPAAATQGA